MEPWIKPWDMGIPSLSNVCLGRILAWSKAGVPVRMGAFGPFEVPREAGTFLKYNIVFGI
jgi:hypothetical protein